MSNSTAPAPPAQPYRVLAALAATDWVIAVGMLVTGTRHDLAGPLAGVAAAAMLTLQGPWLTSVVRSVATTRRLGGDGWRTAERVLAGRLGRRTARLVLREPRLLWSLVLLARRRYDGCPAPRFTGYRDVLPPWLVLAGVAGLELAFTPLLPLPPAIEVTLLVLGTWGLLVTAGLIAALIVHPHIVTRDHLRVRTGCWEELSLPRGSVRRATLEIGSAPRGLTIDGSDAHLTPSGLTNVLLHLAPPVPVGEGTITTLRLWADDPAALRDALRSQ